MDKGVRFGRPKKLTPHQRQEALQRLANGETLVDVARTFAVDPTTIGRLQAVTIAGEPLTTKQVQGQVPVSGGVTVRAPAALNTHRQPRQGCYTLIRDEERPARCSPAGAFKTPGARGRWMDQPLYRTMAFAPLTSGTGGGRSTAPLG